MTIPISEIAQQRTVRLIPSAYYKPAVIRALVDTDAEYDVLAELEGLTSSRLQSTPIAGIGDGWGRSHIEAAFTYIRVGGNRFNDENTGAWYAGFDERTSLAEVAYHRTRELSFIDRYIDEAAYRALHASFIGRFHDVRGLTGDRPYLDPDVAVGHPLGQKLANDLIAGGSRGLIYPSVRQEGGTCLVAFQPNAVQDVAPGAHWKLEWTGTPRWTATAI